jgi:quercetin dioxygenase-like cupin family protein
MPEARLDDTPEGRVPDGEGWFVLNARETPWLDGPFGAYVRFEGQPRHAELGVNLAVLAPGQPASNYHAEGNQEAFLVLRGRCLLLVEGEERLLGPWDFFHCPAGTEHALVGAGDGPCVVLALGGRQSREVVYPVSELARRHGAGVAQETGNPAEAYACVEPDVAIPYRPGWLPGD